MNFHEIKNKANLFLFEVAQFPNRFAARVWLALACILLPLSLILRFYFLENALIEPHPIRQTQTGLAIVQFFKHSATLFDYRSPLDGRLWAFVYEFPIYQWIVSEVMRTGLSLEVASRLTTLFFFFVGAATLGWLLLRLAGRQSAVWGLLFYLILPFNVIYSRTCLVDFTAVAFELLCLAFLVKSWEETGHRFLLALIGMTFFGMAACVTKVMIWHSPTLITSLVVVYLGWKDSAKRYKTVVVLSSFLLQLIIAVLWIRWTVLYRAQSLSFSRS